MRKFKFTNGEYYHIFNRGVDKRKVFLNDNDYLRFLLSLKLLNDEQDGLMILWRDFKKSNPKVQLSDFLKLNFRKREPLVEIVAYCPNPNHYHLILKQLTDKSIERFMQKFGTSYTNYFNQKHDRNGALFQGRFKSSHIDSNQFLLHLSAYVNCNSEVHGICLAENYKWCSFPDYIGIQSSTLGFPKVELSKEIILSQFKNPREYLTFAKNSAMDMKERKDMEKLLE